MASANSSLVYGIIGGACSVLLGSPGMLSNQAGATQVMPANRTSVMATAATMPIRRACDIR